VFIITHPISSAALAYRTVIAPLSHTQGSFLLSCPSQQHEGRPLTERYVHSSRAARGRIEAASAPLRTYQQVRAPSSRKRDKPIQVTDHAKGCRKLIVRACSSPGPNTTSHRKTGRGTSRNSCQNSQPAPTRFIFCTRNAIFTSNFDHVAAVSLPCASADPSDPTLMTAALHFRIRATAPN